MTASAITVVEKVAKPDNRIVHLALRLSSIAISAHIKTKCHGSTTSLTWDGFILKRSPTELITR